MIKHRIVTISRQFGSGGRTVGRRLAERLGIPCYDQELLEKIAEESGLDKEYIKERGEYSIHSSWLANAFISRDATGRSPQDYLWAIQRKIILEIAEKEPCVIVGRCADYILQDRADCLNVFIHASMESRAERIVTQYGETDEAPRKRLQDKDKRRAAYYQFYTDRQWGDAANYDIAMDSGKLGIDTCVDILEKLY